MIIILSLAAVAWWYKNMAQRRAQKLPVADWERALASRLNRGLRWALLIAFVAWLVLLVVYLSHDAAMEAAQHSIRQCTERVDGHALQACMEAPQRMYMDSASASMSARTLLWIVGVL